MPALVTAARQALTRRPTHLVAAALMATWCWVALRGQLPILVAALAATGIALWIVRRRRAVAAAFAIAALGCAAPAVAILVFLQRTPAEVDTAALLTGYLLIGPVPTLTTWTLRPAVISRTRAALLGTLAQLGCSAVAVAFPAAAAVLLPVGTATICASIWRINQRKSVSGVPLTHGWTDFGARQVRPDGLAVHHLILGRGHGICAWRTPHRQPGRVALAAAVRRAADIADTIGLPATCMQPVLLSENAGPLPTRHLVNTGRVAAVVIVARPAQLADLTLGAPRRRLHGHHAARAAAAFPAPPRTSRLPARVTA